MKCKPYCTALTGVFSALVLVAAAFGQQGPEASIQTYPLQHVEANYLRTVLARMLADQQLHADLLADPRANRMLVRATPNTHRVVGQMIRSLDVPPRQEPQQPPPVNQQEEPILRAYPYSGDQLATQTQYLQDQFRQIPNVRIAADDRTQQIIVLAPPQIQQQVAQMMQGGPRSTVPVREIPTVQRNPAPERPWDGYPVPRSPDPIGPIVPLNNASHEDVLALLQRLWGENLQPLPSDHGDIRSFRFQRRDGQQVYLQVNRRTNEIALQGDQELTQSLRHFVRVLDAVPALPNQRTHVVVPKTADAKKIQQAVDAFREGKPTITPASLKKQSKQDWNGNHFIQRMFQPKKDQLALQEAEEQPEKQSEEPPKEQPAETPPQLPPGVAESPLGNVRIEYIEGLDAFVIRGAKEDVRQIVKIIEDIERVSKETEPRIEVYPLKHVGSAQLTELVRQIYDEVFSLRQGQVSITALIKPNGILLIGQPKNVDTVIELIERLDQPVRPATQFEVFRLEHTSAQAAQQTITEFFAERESLGTRVLVTADFRSNSLIVQASPRDMAEVMLLLKRIDTSENQTVSELRVFPLKNALADQLAPVLQAAIGSQADGAATTAPTPVPGQAAGATTTVDKSTILRFSTIDREGQKKLQSGILTDVRITADTRSNALLVSAPADSMPLLEELIQQLDGVPGTQTTIKVFTILNGDASTLAGVLSTLFGLGTQTGAAPGVAPGVAGGFQNQALPTGPQAGESSLVPLRFAVDVRTNSIIAIGLPEDLTVVEAILLRLDEQEILERQTVVYRLHNAPAFDVATAIQAFLDQRRNLQTIDPTAISFFEQLEREVVVVPELVTNSLILSATPRYFDEISRLIERLDQRPPMVLIQVLLASVMLNSTDEFGIEMGLQSSILFDRGVLGGNIVGPGFLFNNQQLANSNPNNPGPVGGQGLTSFSLGRTNSDLGFGGFVMAASSQNVSVLLRALKESRRMEVLARPQVMTLDNQPAFVQVGERVPRVTGTTTNQNGQTSTTTLDNVGLILGVTPRITPDNLVVMEVDAENSAVGPVEDGIPISFGPDGQVINSPRIETTTAQTTISSLSGQTVVIGGLITTTTQKFHRTVPLLGDIPVIRNFFRYDGLAQARSELLIVLTPHIVRTEEEAERLKHQEAARMSWCVRDVEKLSGDIGIRSRYSDWSDHEVEVVYPHGGEPSKMDVISPLNEKPVPIQSESPEPVVPMPVQPQQSEVLPSLPQFPPQTKSSEAESVEYTQMQPVRYFAPSNQANTK